MIVGEGATLFARESNIPIVNDNELITEYERRHLEQLQNYAPAVKSIFGDQTGHDTVGACAIDLKGNFAACTSTGGVTYKRVGRVGDSPLPGAGAWADERGASSTTGHGEGITKALLAKRVVDGIDHTSVKHSAKNGIEYMLDKIGSRGGTIALSRDDFAYHFNTKRMPWCHLSGDGSHNAFGINPNEVFKLE